MTKKNLLILLFAFTISTSVKAQSEFRGWTIKAGANYSSFIDNSKINVPYTGNFGFTAGLAFDWSFTKVIGLSAEALFSTVGSSADLSVIQQGVSIKEIANYISIPILANIYITKGLTAKAGVQLSYIISATDEIKGTSTPQNFDLIKRYNAFDFAIPVGLSYEFDFGLVIDARYTFGLTNVVKEAHPALGDFKATNCYATLTLGYRF